MPQLLILDPQGNESRHPLTGGDAILGRESGVDIVLRDRKVSRKHARVFMRGPHYWVEDLGSANGVLMSGTPIPGARKLVNGSEVDVGGFRITYAEDPDRLAATTFTLVGLVPPVEGKSYILPLGDLEVGRGEECAIRVQDPSISRRHAVLEVTAQGIIVEDQGSSNGTKVNDGMVGRAELRPGDRLQFGNISFDVATEGAPVGGAAVGPMDSSLRLAAIIGAFAMVVLFAILALVVHRQFNSGNSDVFTAYERRVNAGLSAASDHMKATEWEEAVAAYSDVIEQDPINSNAIRNMATAEKNLDDQKTLARARADVGAKRLLLAHRMLKTIDDTAHYGEQAKEYRLDIARALVEGYVRLAATRCTAQDWLRCHRNIVLVLDLQPDNRRARDLQRLAEENLRAARQAFVPWIP